VTYFFHRTVEVVVVTYRIVKIVTHLIVQSCTVVQNARLRRVVDDVLISHQKLQKTITVVSVVSQRGDGEYRIHQHRYYAMVPTRTTYVQTEAHLRALVMMSS